MIEGCQRSIHFSCLSNDFEEKQINGILADVYNTWQSSPLLRHVFFKTLFKNYQQVIWKTGKNEQKKGFACAKSQIMCITNTIMFVPTYANKHKNLLNYNQELRRKEFLLPRWVAITK